MQTFLNDLFRGLEGSADRRFELSAPVTGTVDADEDRIAQVIRNLTRNAIEHTGPGGLVRLTAKAHGERLELAVEDDGPGIPEAEHERIFDRFHRTDGSRARSLGGSGLGLAIARAIVLAHGGRIWADQSPEGGARIVLELPLFAGQLTVAADRRRPTRSEPTVGPLRVVSVLILLRLASYSARLRSGRHEDRESQADAGWRGSYRRTR